MALFVAADLTTPLGRTVTDAQATLAERVVWGWLKPILDLAARPDPVPEDVFAWAVELGAIYLANPEGLSSYQLDSERSYYSSERRAEILAAAASGGLPAGAAPKPVGSFPPARAYPDPVEW